MGLLNRMKEMAEGLADGIRGFDPSVFDDPVAEATEWGPLAGGGTNICTHSLKQTSRNRVEFKATLMGMLFPGIFIAVGLFIMGAVLVKGIETGDGKAIAIGMLFGLIFGGAGLLILWSTLKPRVFDGSSGMYWRGRQQPARGLREDPGKRTFCMLEEIYAVQIIREYCRGSRSNGRRSRSYYSYEINLVLEDGSRMNVVDHGKLRVIIRDANALADFLGVPCWDATKVM